MIPLRWSFLGRVRYPDAVALMERLREGVIAGDSPGALLFLEHEPVITLGRHGDPTHVLAPGLLAAHGIEVVRTTRGGDVTAHGPGQLIIYPVVRLRRGVLDFVEAVGGAIAAELDARGIGGAEFRRQPVGVWVGEAKIAAVGLHVRRRVTAHGFALNVSRAALALFDAIVPCGIAGGRVTAIESLAGAAPPLAELAGSLADRIARAIGCSIERSPAEIRP